MIYTVQYEVDMYEAQTPREAAQMTANGLARGEHFPMTFDVFGPDGVQVSTETVTRIEEVALLETPVTAAAATDEVQVPTETVARIEEVALLEVPITALAATNEEPWPAGSVMAALEELLAGDRGLDREQVRAYLIENEDRLWKQFMGPMADEIEGEYLGEISADERYNDEHPAEVEA